MKPILIPYRNGGVWLGGKDFGMGDIKRGIILRSTLVPDNNWFGGNVYAFGKTEDGFLLCVGGQIDEQGNMFSSNTVIGLYVPTLDGLSDKAVKMLEDAGCIPKEPEPIAETVIEPVEDEPDDVDEPEPVMPENVAEITRKITEIVNKKVATRPRRVTKAGAGKKR